MDQGNRPAGKLSICVGQIRDRPDRQAVPLSSRGVSLSKSKIVQSRVWAAIVTGGGAFILLLLLMMPGDLASAIGIFVAAALGVALFAAWLMRRGTPPRSAWGAGCFINGLLSTAVAAGFRTQNDFWAGGSQYAEDLNRAIGPLTHFAWEMAARVGLVALVLAVVLFALSYWLLGPPHRKA
jgi:hypothetical protein